MYKIFLIIALFCSASIAQSRAEAIPCVPRTVQVTGTVVPLDSDVLFLVSNGYIYSRIINYTDITHADVAHDNSGRFNIELETCKVYIFIPSVATRGYKHFPDDSLFLFFGPRWQLYLRQPTDLTWTVERRY